MKALIVPEYDRFGGTFTVFRKTLRFHALHGIRTAVLITPSQDTPEARAVLEESGAQVFWMPDRDKRYMKSWAATAYEYICGRGAVRRFDPDVIHVSCGGPGNMLGFLLFDKPVVFTLVTTPFGRLQLGRDIVARRTVGPRKLFTTDSHCTAAKIRDIMGLPSDGVHVIHNSCPVSDGPRDPDPDLVLTMGHFVDYKNPSVWLKTAQMVLAQRPRTRFLWLGEGAALEDYRSRISALGLTGSVVLEGFRPNVADYMRRAAVYFHPSRLESHGIAVVEAMAHSVPCVSSNAGGLKESIVEGSTGFLHDPDDAEGFARHILGLLDRPEQAAIMGAAGRAHVAAHFSEEAWQNAFLALYRKVIEAS